MKVPIRKGGDVVAHVEIDDCDVHLLKWRWSFNNKGYARRTICVGSRKTSLLLHRAVLALELNGHAAQLTVDHVNCNILDCRRSNLKIMPRDENTAKGNRTRHRPAPPIPV